jgi:hypothetical protein
VLRHHLARIHPVDVVGTEHHEVLGLLVDDQVGGLEDGIGAAGVPTRAESLLRRDGRHVVAEHRRHAPGLGDVPIQRVRLVLGEHADAQVSGVDQVRQREVHESVGAGERDGRFGAVRGEGIQPFAFATGEDDAQNVWRSSHGWTISSLSGCH